MFAVALNEKPNIALISSVNVLFAVIAIAIKDHFGLISLVYSGITYLVAIVIVIYMSNIIKEINNKKSG
jgi:hypothetical protein